MVTLPAYTARPRPRRLTAAAPEPVRALLVLLVSAFLALTVLLGLTSLLSPWA